MRRYRGYELDQEPEFDLNHDPDPGDLLGPPDPEVSEPEVSDAVPIRSALDCWLDHLEGRINKNDDLHVMPYQRYLSSPEWDEVRRLAVRMANFQCQHCGASRRELHVHHRTYARRGYEDLRDLVVLCAACHRAEHGIEEP